MHHNVAEGARRGQNQCRMKSKIKVEAIRGLHATLFITNLVWARLGQHPSQLHRYEQCQMLHIILP